MIKLLLVDDHSIFRSGIREMIERESDIKVMAEAGTSVEALISAKKQNSISRYSTFHYQTAPVSI